MADWATAKATAQKVIKDYKVKEPASDMYRVARELGIKIVPLIPRLGEREFSGFLDSNGDKPVIYVNPNESIGRQTWTIGHELGHYFLKHTPDHWGINWRDSQPGDIKDEFEQAADYFAACFLIPKDRLVTLMKQYKLTHDDFRLLADMFGVSADAMKNRLSFLHL